MTPLSSFSSVVIITVLFSQLPVEATPVGMKGPACGKECKGLFIGQCKPYFCPPKKECVQRGVCTNPPGIVKCKKTTKAVCMKPYEKEFDDPHMLGFDRTTFVFHGVKNRHYMLFGRKAGDFIVGKMISTSKVNSVGVPVTCFGEIGASVGKLNDKVLISLEGMRDPSMLENTFSVRLNGKLLSKDYIGEDYQVAVSQIQKAVRIETAEASYRILALSTGTASDQLYLKIFLRRQTTAVDAYVGVLGVALNRKTARDFFMKFSGLFLPSRVEHHFHAIHEVPSMFPECVNNGERASRIGRFDESRFVNADDKHLVAEFLV